MDRHTLRADADTFLSIQRLGLGIQYPISIGRFLRIQLKYSQILPKVEYYPQVYSEFARTQDSSAHIRIEYFAFGSLNTLDHSRRKSPMNVLMK